MSDELWRVTEVTLIRGPHFGTFLGRDCGISFSVEGEDGREKWMSVVFTGTETYRCAYMTALTHEMVRTAYNRLADCGKTPWLEEISARNTRYREARQMPVSDLHHLMMCFDDGPCWEVICTGFRITEGNLVPMPVKLGK